VGGCAPPTEVPLLRYGVGAVTANGGTITMSPALGSESCPPKIPIVADTD